jgi:hypothetical protein
MPEIPLLDRDGKPLSPVPSFLILQSIMLSPDDSDSTQSFLAMACGSSSYSALLKQTILHFTKASTGGAIAGDVFLLYLQMTLHSHPVPSIAKAAFVVSGGLEGTSLHSGRAAPQHVDRVHRFWGQFRRAAHLWAALRLVQGAGRTALSPKSSDSEIAELNDHIILCSDLLLSAAVAADMAIDPDPWKLPDAYPRKVYHIDIPPLTDQALERLTRYRVAARSK